MKIPKGCLEAGNIRSDIRPKAKGQKTNTDTKKNNKKTLQRKLKFEHFELNFNPSAGFRTNEALC